MAYVQSTSVYSGGRVASQAQAYTNPVTAGRLLVAVIGLDNPASTLGITSVADALGQTWTQAVAGAAFGFGGSQVFIYYKENTAGGANTLTVTPTSNTEIYLSIAEYDNVLTASLLDKTSANDTGNAFVASPITSNATATTAQANELLIGGAMINRNTTVTFTAGSGYTMRENPGTTVNAQSTFADQLVSATGAYAATFTYSGTQRWGAAIATFKVQPPPLPRAMTSVPRLRPRPFGPL